MVHFALRCRLTLRFQNFQRATWSVVIEYADDEAPCMPSKGVEVGSVLFKNRAVGVRFMAVYDMALPMTAIVAVTIDLPDDFLWALLIQRASRINAGMYKDAVFIDVHQW